MIVFGVYECLDHFVELYPDSIILNFTSFKEGIDKLNLLPSFQGDIFNGDSKQFDIAYASEIMNNNNMFYEFMASIILPVYNNINVYILISEGFDNIDYVVESLQKLIQSRYGLISNNVYNVIDIEYLTECNFTMDGLYNLDVDKDRFAVIHYEKTNNAMV